MVDTVPAAGAASAPLPDRSVVPPVWGRITNLVVDHGEGSWLVTPDGDRYLDYTSGIGVTNTGHAHPRVVGGDPGAGREAAPRPAEHRLPRARASGSTSGSPACCRTARGRRSSPTAAPRRSRRRSSSPGSRPAGRRSSRSATASTAGPRRRWR